MTYTVGRYLSLLSAGVVMWFAVDRWIWFRTYPRLVSRCGNCFLAAVGVPFEIGLLGAVIAFAAIANIRYTRQFAALAVCAIAGVLATPFVVGVPIFAVALAVLIGSVARSVLELRSPLSRYNRSSG
jgi:hypothetical protein